MSGIQPTSDTWPKWSHDSNVKFMELLRAEDFEVRARVKGVKRDMVRVHNILKILSIVVRLMGPFKAKQEISLSLELLRAQENVGGKPKRTVNQVLLDMSLALVNPNATTEDNYHADPYRRVIPRPLRGPARERLPTREPEVEAAFFQSTDLERAAAERRREAAAAARILSSGLDNQGLPETGAGPVTTG